MGDGGGAVLIVAAAELERASLPGGTLLVQHRGTPWRQTAIIRLGGVPAVPLAERVVAAATDPVRAVLARVQPGLEMWDPRGKPRIGVGVVEYVTSAPETRQAYYDSQYAASGPAMRELWSLGWVQRFVGFEAREDLIATEHGGWDVLHVTELSLLAMPRMLFWARHFDEYARRAGCGTMRELSAQWDAQRTKIEQRATIQLT
jgi:hypothetical protein